MVINAIFRNGVWIHFAKWLHKKTLVDKGIHKVNYWNQLRVEKHFN